MITRVPKFRPGEDYRELRGGRHRFETLTVTRFPVASALPRLAFRDREGVMRLVFTPDRIVIPARYAWDGCTPKKWFMGRWWGTPDPEPTRPASLLHDVLYQFMHHPEMPFSREEMDLMFLRVMRLGGFRWANTYYGAVTDFGGMFSRPCGPRD